jgi:hypothetical protein
MSLVYQVPTRTDVLSNFKETLSMPTLEGAAGVVGGIVAGDFIANLAVTTLNMKSTTANLVIKGVAKFFTAGLALALTASMRGAARLIGTGAAIGSVAGWFIDLLAASPWAKSLGLASVRLRQIGVGFKQPPSNMPPGSVNARGLGVGHA